MKVIVSPPEETTEIDFVFWFVVTLFQESLIVPDKGKLSFVVGERDPIETPGVPRIDISLWLDSGDKGLRRFFYPEGMSTGRTNHHLLSRSDIVVVKHLAVGVEDSFVDKFGLEVTTFNPSVAVWTLEVIWVKF